MSRIVIATANRDFDPTEVAVPWDVLRQAGIEVVFATEDGWKSQCDPLTLSSPIADFLSARPENVRLYNQLEQSTAFQTPIQWADINADEFDGLILPGGHAPGMRRYLESTALQEVAAQFLHSNRLVGAICHGPLVLSRAKDPATGSSALAGRTVTALPRRMERSAWMMTSWKLGRYYRTYPTWVQDEITGTLGSGSFKAGPILPSYAKPFVIQDRNLITARWPGDAQCWSERIRDALLHSGKEIAA